MVIIQHIASAISMNHLVTVIPTFQRVHSKHTWRHQVIIQYSDILPVNIIESCHSEGAKLELIQFVTVTIQTLIKKA